MEQVRRAVIGTNAVAARGIDAELHGIADLERARLQLRLMRVQAAERLARIADGRLRSLQRRDRPRVAHLAAALAIEGRLVGQHGDIVARTWRSEEHTSELQSLMRNSYAVFCLKKTTKNNITKNKRD